MFYVIEYYYHHQWFPNIGAGFLTGAEKSLKDYVLSLKHPHFSIDK